MRLPRWLRRLTFSFLAIVVVIGVILFIGRSSFNRIGERRLAEVTHRLDAQDPAWRLNEIESARARAKPPSEQNPSLAVLRLEEGIPTEWRVHSNSEDGFSGPVTNQYPSFQELLWLLRGRAVTADVRAAARADLLRADILSQPGGYYPLTHGDNPWMTLLPHMQKARSVLALIDYDARLAVLEGDPDRGIRDARAALVIARSVGDEPFIVSQLVRMACAQAAITTALQTLAWGRPSHDLAELQAELLTEANFPRLQVGLRGERAMLDKAFENFQSGKISTDDFARSVDRQPGFMTDTLLRFYKGVLPEDRAASLRLMTEYLEAAKLPYHEQKAAFARVQLPPRPPDDFRYLFTHLFVPSCAKIGEGSLRTRAELVSASVAVACERFRLAHGRWPESLAEIPKTILSEIPTDPFDGQLLKYKKLGDGVVVYARDWDGYLARRWREGKDPVAEFGLGCKLWNPEVRGVTAEPETVPLDNDRPIGQPVIPPREGSPTP